MATVSERARELQEIIEEIPSKSWEFKIGKLIEQALLAERRLAMEEAAKIAQEPIARLIISRDKAKAAGRECVSSCRESDIETRYAVANALRAAAEKEVGK